MQCFHSIIGAAIFSVLVLVSNTTSATVDYIDATDSDDTIVYGEIVKEGLEYDPDHQQWYWVYYDVGPGVCVFQWSSIYPFRGNYLKKEKWDAGSSFGIYGEANNTGTSDDLIHPADMYDGNPVYCTSTGGYSYYITIDSWHGYYFPTSSSLYIYGDKGADYGGDDVIWGWDNTDYIYGGEGADLIEGQGGADSLYGGAGNDDIYGGSGNDTIRGNSGVDFLFGEDGSDTLYGNDWGYYDTCDNLDGGGGLFHTDTCVCGSSGHVVGQAVNCEGTVYYCDSDDCL